MTTVYQAQRVTSPAEVCQSLQEELEENETDDLLGRKEHKRLLR